MRRYGVTSIPTLLLLDGGKEVDRHVGPAGLKPILDRAYGR